MSKQVKGYIYAGITITIWSSTFLVSKQLLESLTSIQILLGRFMMAIVALSIVYPKFNFKLKWREELYFLIIGGGLAFYFYFEAAALKHTYASNVSLIVAAIPLLTGVLSMVINKTSFLNPKSIAGFFIAYGGVALIILNGSGVEGVEPIGDVFTLIASVMFAIYTIYMQRVQKGYHIVALTRKVFIYAFFIILIVALVRGEQMIITEINRSDLMRLIYLGIISSTFAFLMWNRAIEYLGSVMTNQFIYLGPIITTVASVLVLDEQITIYTIVGGILIIGGLYLSEMSQKKKQNDDKAPFQKVSET